jgi:N utilization substance protein B
MFQKDIPSTVTIDEAVDISKNFGTEDSYRFVNGVLDAVRKSLDSAGSSRVRT